MSPHWVAAAIARFTDRFGAAPTWATLAPGRVNLIGEHTDYCGGLVLPMAIDRHVLALAGDATSDRSSLWAMDIGTDEVVEARLDGPLQPGERAFANYVLGVVDQFARLGRSLPPLNLAFAGTVPVGHGLSSSAALEVATGTLLERFGDPLAPVELALLCQRAEHLFGGTPCGIMDVLVSVAARPGHAMLIDCSTNASRNVPLPDDDGLAILVADTGVRRTLAESAYGQRRTTCEAVAARLGLEHLCDATLDDLRSGGLTHEQHRRATHVIEENARTLDAVAALERGDLPTLGQRLLDGHRSLRELYEVSCPELDTVVDAAAELTGSGVYGARMTGAGFGGSAVILCEPASEASVCTHVAGRFRERHHRIPTIFRVKPAGGAEVVTIPPGRTPQPPTPTPWPPSRTDADRSRRPPRR